MRHPTWIALVALIASATAAPAVASDYADYPGAELYRRFCASCHGKGGLGDGPVAGTLAAPLPDLTRISARHGGKFPDNWVYRVIDGREVIYGHGLREMPVWGTELWREQGADVTAGAKTRDAIARLVDYLKGLQAPRTLGDPGH